MNFVSVVARNAIDFFISTIIAVKRNDRDNRSGERKRERENSREWCKDETLRIRTDASDKVIRCTRTIPSSSSMHRRHGASPCPVYFSMKFRGDTLTVATDMSISLHLLPYLSFFSLVHSSVDYNYIFELRGWRRETYFRSAFGATLGHFELRLLYETILTSAVTRCPT